MISGKPAQLKGRSKLQAIFKVIYIMPGLGAFFFLYLVVMKVSGSCENIFSFLRYILICYE